MGYTYAYYNILMTISVTIERLKLRKHISKQRKQTSENKKLRQTAQEMICATVSKISISFARKTIFRNSFLFWKLDSHIFQMELVWLNLELICYLKYPVNHHICAAVFLQDMLLVKRVYFSLYKSFLRFSFCFKN